MVGGTSPEATKAPALREAARGGQEASAFGVRGPSRQLVLPYEKRPRWRAGGIGLWRSGAEPPIGPALRETADHQDGVGAFSGATAGWHGRASPTAEDGLRCAKALAREWIPVRLRAR